MTPAAKQKAADTTLIRTFYFMLKMVGMVEGPATLSIYPTRPNPMYGSLQRARWTTRPLPRWAEGTKP